jgi:hypothetical protein
MSSLVNLTHFLPLWMLVNQHTLTKLYKLNTKFYLNSKKLLKIKSPDHWKVARWKENRSPKASYNKKI